jgi:hypothetical protein
MGKRHAGGFYQKFFIVDDKDFDAGHNVSLVYFIDGKGKRFSFFGLFIDCAD